MVPLGRIDGQVHSVFDKVCNLRLCDGSFLALGREDVFMDLVSSDARQIVVLAFWAI